MDARGPVHGRPRASSWTSADAVNVRERSWTCPRTSTGVHGRPRTTSMGIFVDTSMDRSTNVRGHVRGQRPWTCPLFVGGRRRTSMDPPMDKSTDMSMDKSTACPRTCPRTRAMDVVGGRVRVRKFVESIRRPLMFTGRSPMIFCRDLYMCTDDVYGRPWTLVDVSVNVHGRPRTSTDGRRRTSTDVHGRVHGLRSRYRCPRSRTRSRTCPPPPSLPRSRTSGPVGS